MAKVTPTKWVHFTGIVGKTMGPLAYAFKEKGWYVTGSDKSFYPPMSTYLTDRNIQIEVGFKEKYLTKKYYKKKLGENFSGTNIGENPDLHIIIATVTEKNKEYAFSKKKGLKILNYPQVLQDQLIVKGKSIVVSGTYGKTTTSGLLVHIFREAGKDISYMFSGISEDIPNGVRLKDEKTEWSIVEGDEYYASAVTKKSKFFYYHPTHLILTAAEWDHTDIFKTEQDFVDNFRKLAETLPKDGLIVASKNGKNLEEVLENVTAKIIWYEYHEKKFDFKTKLIGNHNKENIVAAVTLARNLDLPADVIKKAVESYKGIKRRLEIKLQLDNTIIIEDEASSPPKVKGSLKTLSEDFGDYKTYAIFEPNAGNRTKEAIPLYEEVFENAEQVIIPRLLPIKSKKGKRLNGREITEVISKSHKNVAYMNDEGEILDHLRKIKGKKIITFMGSRGFRGMIDQTIEKLQNPKPE